MDEDAIERLLEDGDPEGEITNCPSFPAAHIVGEDNPGDMIIGYEYMSTCYPLVITNQLVTLSDEIDELKERFKKLFNIEPNVYLAAQLL